MGSVGFPTVSDLTNQQLTLLAVIAASVAAIAFLMAIFLFFRLRKLSRQHKVIRGDGDERDLLTTLAGWNDKLSDYGQRLDSVSTDLKREISTRRLALQRFFVVRYDAFEEMGGRLSFSAAFLDDHGDGLLITSINGRTESRTYSKAIRNLTSEHNLSEEEREAISKAMAGAGRSASERKQARMVPEGTDDRSQAG